MNGSQAHVSERRGDGEWLAGCLEPSTQLIEQRGNLFRRWRQEHLRSRAAISEPILDSSQPPGFLRKGPGEDAAVDCLKELSLPDESEIIGTTRNERHRVAIAQDV
jgi:hypothetical protein